MIKVYKSNIDDKQQRSFVISKVSTHFPHCKATVDLDDCERVLRLAGVRSEEEADTIIDMLEKEGFQVELMTW